MLVTPSVVGIRKNDKKIAMFVLMLRLERISCGVQTTGPRRSMELGFRCKNHKNSGSLKYGGKKLSNVSSFDRLMSRQNP
jgi:hypothetical protein